MCCCYKFKKKASVKENPRDGLTKLRVCTDCWWVPVFLFFWVGMIVISIFAYSYGNPSTMIEPTDYEQNMCGWGLGEGNNNQYDLKNYPFLWYPIKTDLDVIKTVTYAYNAYYEGICVKECPTDIYDEKKLKGIVCDYNFKQFEGTETGVMLVKQNNGSCYANNFGTGLIYKRCIPSFFNSSSFVTDQIITVYNWAISGTTVMFAELVYSWLPLILTSIIVFVLCFVFVSFISTFSDLFVFIIILLVFLMILGSAIYCIYFSVSNFALFHSTGDIVDRNVGFIYLALGLFLSFLELVYCILLLFILKRLRLAIGIIKESTKAVWAMPTMILVPFFTMILTILTIAFSGSVALYLQSITSTITYDLSKISEFLSSLFKTDLNLGVISITRGDWIHTIMMLYNLFGFLWTAAFLSAFGYTVIAMCVVMWYFSTPSKQKILSCKPKKLQLFPVTRAFLKVFIFHTGSIIFGSLLVAIIQFIRILVREAEKRLRTGKKKKAKATIILKIVQILLFIFEQIIKFINKNAYIMICIHSDLFIIAALKGFLLIIQNILRVVATNFIGNFILFLGKVVITILGGITAYSIVYSLKYAGIFIYFSAFDFVLIDYQYIQYGIVPTVIGAIISFLIANMFFSVFGTSIDTILLCFCADIKYCGRKGIPHYYPASLMSCVSKNETQDSKNKEYHKKRRELKKKLKKEKKLKKMRKKQKRMEKKMKRKMKKDLKKQQKL